MKKISQSFFFVVSSKIDDFANQFLDTVLQCVQLLPGGWIFLLPTFSAAFRMLRQYRIILSAAAAGAVLEPLGGNCAVLP